MSKPEKDIQNDIMIALGSHPRVAWQMVITTGKFRIKGAYITTGQYMTEHLKRHSGISDIIGQLVNGLFFCIEIKKPKEKPTPEQYEFMELVSRNGGISGFATNVNEAIRIIEG